MCIKYICIELFVIQYVIHNQTFDSNECTKHNYQGFDSVNEADLLFAVN